ncbi:DNA gyrase inhibitor YacG [Legionella beliardensis]|uniref:DNA gyrase inhibitor YacG n=1 Tax=Legionella beliardensis TaxID=91822 RepID=A0A378I1Z1_9GAMM|nr:DNA gyrase inhibitor YacG [Legionella beliardensis]STX29207.1 DNA gyrase inhibitor YacG [Legionella beliardensis]
MNNHPNVVCPTCGKQNTWQVQNAFRPFCSERCKLIDLGEWANETRKIPGKTLDPNLSVLTDDDPDNF